MDDDFFQFFTTLVEAVSSINQEFIEIRSYDSKGSKYKERVYCYELYHQLRLKTDSKKQHKEELVNYGLTFRQVLENVNFASGKFGDPKIRKWLVEIEYLQNV